MNGLMALRERNRLIRNAIAKQTAANTATRALARAVLVAEGIYTRDGRLTVNYGGSAPAPKAR